jgi:hypothetical protein
MALSTNSLLNPAPNPNDSGEVYLRCSYCGWDSLSINLTGKTASELVGNQFPNSQQYFV